ncbi:amino acid permease [Georgenia sp. SUBG003]|uniref:amino acid permease n=1 Tax=Georgenia sp. SUBG003 TaxID=1497974 RepID=UPI003AB15EA6
MAGSAYTFSYATFGEFVAWIIGWDLVLELVLGAATVSVGWSGYFNRLLGDLGLPLPESIAGETATLNVPAMAIALAVTAVLVLGIKLSSRVTAVIVAIKLAVVLLVIFLGLFYVNTANYTPSSPRRNRGRPARAAGRAADPAAAGGCRPRDVVQASRRPVSV